jgi:hypothetical protein
MGAIFVIWHSAAGFWLCLAVPFGLFFFEVSGMGRTIIKSWAMHPPF